MSPILLLGGVSALLVLGLSSCNGAQGGNLVPVKKTSQPRAAIDHEAIIARDRVKFGFPREIRFHPKGEVIAVATEGLVEIRGGSSLKFLYALAERERKPERANSLDFSPDGKFLAADYPKESKPWRHAVAIWDWKARRIVTHTGEHSRRIVSVRFSPNGRWIATAGEDKIVKVWLVADGALVREVKVDTPGLKPIRRAEFSPDGRLLAVQPLFRDSVLLFLSTDSWGMVAKLARPEEARLSFDGLAFSPDGKRVFTTCGSLVAWRVGDWKVEVTYNPREPHMSYSSKALAISPDGKTAALGTSEGAIQLIRFRDFGEASVRVFPKGAASQISGVHFSPDGKRLAVAGANGCAIIDVQKAMR